MVINLRGNVGGSDRGDQRARRLWGARRQAEGESTAEWPYNLGDELTDEQLARYERACAARDASGVMDLLDGGSTMGVQKLCARFGVLLAVLGYA